MNKLLVILLCVFILISCGGGQSSSTSTTPPTTATRVESRPATTVEETLPEESSLDPMEEVVLLSPDGDAIKTSLAFSGQDQRQGLSGVQPENFDDDMGKLFMYLSDISRVFWMPNTYFDLDVIYLDSNLKILRIVRDLPFYTGNVNAEIPRAPAITSRHVLEMKSGSAIADSLAVGESLQWESSLSLSETISEINEKL